MFETNIEFVEVVGNTLRCWYMNSGGKGPSYEILLTYTEDRWLLDFKEHPPGTEADDRRTDS